MPFTKAETVLGKMVDIFLLFSPDVLNDPEARFEYASIGKIDGIIVD